MSRIGLTQNQLTGSVFSYWRDLFSPEVKTVFPGMQIDTAKENKWVELWMQSTLRKPQRVTSQKLHDVSILVHCFSHAGNERSHINQLAETSLELLSQQILVIRDFEQAGVPIVGYLKLYEAESRILTRNRLEKESGLQHIVVTCDGIAQSLI